jgi:hypothetical protein
VKILQRQTDAFQIVPALSSPGRISGRLQSGHQHGDEQANNGDRNQQLHKRKCGLPYRGRIPRALSAVHDDTLPERKPRQRVGLRLWINGPEIDHHTLILSAVQSTNPFYTDLEMR